jgi:alanyl-tRNA synthetase
MTERLYLTDGYLTRFTAAVKDVRAYAERYEILLDKTAFYPTSGGQLHDVGRLGGRRVVDVQERGDQVVHIVDGSVPFGEVEGEIDWRVRFDHMQQHSGQHLLSACLEEALAAPTLSFHMGDETCTIDLGIESLNEGALHRAEDLVNERIWENRPIHARFVTDEELRALPLRKDPAVSEDVRVVSIEGVDHSPCGGTHLHATGEIGAVHLLGTERVRDATRLTFVCGRRALLHARVRRHIVGALAARFTTRDSEVTAAIAKLDDAARAARKREQALTQELARADAAAVLAGRGSARPAPLASAAGARGLIQIGEGWSAERAGEFARVVAAGGVVCAVVVPNAGTDRGPEVLLAAPREVGVDASAVLREVLARGGKGGGSREFARGALPRELTAPDAAERLARAMGIKHSAEAKS